jgi:L-fuconolactonase
MIVDAHQHFWDPARAEYPWMTVDMGSIRRRFGPEDLAPLVARTGVDGTILVQVQASINETREFLAIAAATPLVAGVVGWVDLAAAGVPDAIASLRSGPGGERLVGLRHQVHDEPDPLWLSRPDVRRGLAAVDRAGLAYDLLVRPRELPAALEAVRALPDVRFVIDHLGKPSIRDRQLQPWADLIAPFGALPNVWCKMSGLVTEAEWGTWQPEDIGPFVDHALEVFGPERLLFGSDWPVCLLAATYDQVLELAERSLAHLDAVGRAAVFGGNAVAAYRLGAAL